MGKLVPWSCLTELAWVAETGGGSLESIREFTAFGGDGSDCSNGWMVTNAMDRAP